MTVSGAYNAPSLEVPVASLHRDWSHDWAPSLRAERTRQAIAGNPRLAHRPSASLAAQLGVGRPDETEINAADAHTFLALVHDPARFLRIAGLASLAPLLATIVYRESVRALMDAFPGEDLQIALSCREEARACGPVDADPEKFLTVVETTGPRFVRDWASALAPEFRVRVRLMLPKSAIAAEFGGLEPPVNHNSGRVVRKIAKLLVSPTQTGTNDHGGD